MKRVSPDTFLTLPPKLRLYVARFELSSMRFFAMIVGERQLEGCKQVSEMQIPFGDAAGQRTALVLSPRYANRISVYAPEDQRSAKQVFNSAGKAGDCR